MNDIKKERRFFLKHALTGTVAVAALAATNVTAKAQVGDTNSGKEVSAKDGEILYKETEAFRKHYKSLYT